LIKWIDSKHKLHQALAELDKMAVLAVDTEFIRTNTFYPEIALIQVSDGVSCWLIDVLAIHEIDELKSLFEDDTKTFIFHACAEDLEVLEHALNVRPKNIFDTQIAAGLVNLGYSLGYASLVKMLFSVELDKQQTRSNWLARPLSQKQLNYAADDVTYLHRMYDYLSVQLEQKKRTEWFYEEWSALRASVDGRKSSLDYYMRIKGAWTLSESSLKTLRRLCNWRESIAKQKNKPRGHIIKDSVLFDVAEVLPSRMDQLAEIEGLHPGMIKRFGRSLLEQVDLAKSDARAKAIPQPLAKTELPILRAMRDNLIHMADKMGIPPELLFSKKELEHILRATREESSEWPAKYISGWRAPLVKPVLSAVLNQADF
jgi:ribonuclease D